MRKTKPELEAEQAKMRARMTRKKTAQPVTPEAPPVAQGEAQPPQARSNCTF